MHKTQNAILYEYKAFSFLYFAQNYQALKLSATRNYKALAFSDLHLYFKNSLNHVIYLNAVNNQYSLLLTCVQFYALDLVCVLI